jgi:hypothetical protein
MKHPPSLSIVVLLGITMLAGIETGLSQGSIYFSNAGANGGARAPVYGPDPENPYRQQWGNTPDAQPPGTQTYGGTPLEGSAYSVQAWYSFTPASDVFALADDATAIPGTLTTFAFLGGGYFSTTETSIPGAVTPRVYLQVRVWDNAGGQLATWEEAWTAAQAGTGQAVGWSKVFEQPLAIQPGIGLINFESFNVFFVPEPGTVWLGVLGGALLLWTLRRRRRERK